MKEWSDHKIKAIFELSTLKNPYIDSLLGLICKFFFEFLFFGVICLIGGTTRDLSWVVGGNVRPCKWLRKNNLNTWLALHQYWYWSLFYRITLPNLKKKLCWVKQLNTFHYVQCDYHFPDLQSEIIRKLISPPWQGQGQVRMYESPPAS